jgi:hypothetical protein
MEVSVTVDLSVEPQERHLAQMRSAACSLTDDPGSVEVICSSTSPRTVRARFSVPDAREGDVIDRIGRQFWQVENFNDSSIGFSRPARRKRPTSGSSQ